jgi:hypothetical protein
LNFLTIIILSYVVIDAVWTEFNGFFYRYDTVRRTWNAAESACVMASIHSLAEYNFVRSLGTLDGVGYWIGARRENPALLNTFTWGDGTPFDFSQWSTNEPNNANGNEHCLRMSSDGWKDAICSTPRPVICKRPVSGSAPTITRRRRRRRAA